MILMICASYYVYIYIYTYIYAYIVSCDPTQWYGPPQPPEAPPRLHRAPPLEAHLATCGAGKNAAHKVIVALAKMCASRLSNHVSKRCLERQSQYPLRFLSPKT